MKNMPFPEISIALARRVFACLATAALLLPFAAPALFAANDSSPGDGVFLSPARLATLKKRVAEKTEPTCSAFLKVQQDADAALGREPAAPERWFVPSFYNNNEAHRAAKKSLQDDANNAYALALAYRMTGDEKYAQAAAKLINAWATNVKVMDTKEDSKLSFNYHFPSLVFAADLIKDSPSWPKDQQEVFKTFVREKALPMRTTTYPNNWGNWGVAFTMACAAYLGDAELLRNASTRWKTLLSEQQNGEGHLVLEVVRNNDKGDYGIWYSHFSLMSQTLAAEIARLNGVDLFDYTSPNGHNLRKAFDALVPWACSPETFPYYQGTPGGQHNTDAISYWEILNAHWPNADATQMIAGLRPLTGVHSPPYMTFTHGDLLNDQ